MKTRKVGYQLFNDNPKGPSKVKAQYGTAERARQTLKRLRGKPKAYQRQVAVTMFYRAKHHKYQTKGMKQAMKVYGHFLFWSFEKLPKEDGFRFYSS
jgi:hypothetical protein